MLMTFLVLVAIALEKLGDSVSGLRFLPIAHVIKFVAQETWALYAWSGFFPDALWRSILGEISCGSAAWPRALS
jgi:hypothetical protein